MDSLKTPAETRLLELVYHKVHHHLSYRAAAAVCPGDRLIDAAYAKFKPRLEERGSPDWDQLGEEIGRYVRAYLSLGDRRGNRSRTVALSQLDLDGLHVEARPAVQTPVLDPFEQVCLHEELDSALRERQRRLRAKAACIRRFLKHLVTVPKDERVRELALYLRLEFEQTPYDRLIAELRNLGFDPPTPSVFRQWVCRHGDKAKARFEAFLSRSAAPQG